MVAENQLSHQDVQSSAMLPDSMEPASSDEQITSPEPSTASSTLDTLPDVDVESERAPPQLSEEAVKVLENLTTTTSASQPSLSSWSVRRLLQTLRQPPSKARDRCHLLVPELPTPPTDVCRWRLHLACILAAVGAFFGSFLDAWSAPALGSGTPWSAVALPGAGGSGAGPVSASNLGQPLRDCCINATSVDMAAQHAVEHAHLIILYAIMVPLGAMLGGVFAGHVADRAGRRPALLCTPLPAFFAWIILLYVDSVAHPADGVKLDAVWFFCIRFLIGLTLGAVFAVQPIYVAECSHPLWRGSAGLWLGAGAALGLPACVLLRAFWPTGSQMAVSLVPLAVTAGYYLLPETPEHLARTGRIVEALAARRLMWGPLTDPAVETDRLRPLATRISIGALEDGTPAPWEHRAALKMLGVRMAAQAAAEIPPEDLPMANSPMGSATAAANAAVAATLAAAAAVANATHPAQGLRLARFASVARRSRARFLLAASAIVAVAPLAAVGTLHFFAAYSAGLSAQEAMDRANSGGYFFSRNMTLGKGAPAVTASAAASVEVVTVILSALLADKVGRRPLLVASTVCIALAHMALALYHGAQEASTEMTMPLPGSFSTYTDNRCSHIGSYNQDERDAASAALLGALSAARGVGAASVAWTTAAELLACCDDRATTCGMLGCARWAAAALALVAFPTARFFLGARATYGALAGACAVAAIVLRRLLPETKRRPLEGIEGDMVSGVPNDDDVDE